MPLDITDVNQILARLGYTNAQIDHAKYAVDKLQADTAKEHYSNVQSKIKIKQKTELGLLVTLLLLENKAITEILINGVNAEIASRKAADTIK